MLFPIVQCPLRQKWSEDNHKLRPGCPHDYQIFEGDYQSFCAIIDPKKSNRNRRMRTDSIN